MRRLLPLLALLAACGDPGPTMRGQSITPRPEWRVDWTTIETCTGLGGNFDQVIWIETPAGTRVRWESPHYIYLPSEVITLHVGALIQHEMLHDLLRGDVNHISPLWEKCLPSS